MSLDAFQRMMEEMRTAMAEDEEDAIERTDRLLDEKIHLKVPSAMPPVLPSHLMKYRRYEMPLKTEYVAPAARGELRAIAGLAVPPEALRCGEGGGEPGGKP